MELALFIGSSAVLVGAAVYTLWYLVKKGKIHLNGPK